MVRKGLVALLALVLLFSTVSAGVLAEGGTFLIGTYLQLTGIIRDSMMIAKADKWIKSNSVRYYIEFHTSTN
jgi:hypothetical protein